jgi:hypothetical protein
LNTCLVPVCRPNHIASESRLCSVRERLCRSFVPRLHSVVRWSWQELRRAVQGKEETCLPRTPSALIPIVRTFSVCVGFHLPSLSSPVKIRSQRSSRVAQTRAELSPLLSSSPFGVEGVDGAEHSDSMDGHTVVLKISDDAKIQIWGFRTNLLKTASSRFSSFSP